MVFIYILKLSKNKYYVGKTLNPHFRIDEHFKYGGSAWTKKYHPQHIVEIIPNCDDYDEDKYTRMYMDRYGIDNVRGGSYVSVHLNKNTRQELLKMRNGTKDRCFKCGKSGHFANRCTQQYVESDGDDNEFVDEYEDDYDTIFCCRCGRSGHRENRCYASRDIEGNHIFDYNY